MRSVEQTDGYSSPNAPTGKELIFAEQAAPGTPPAGTVYVYAKSDGKLYQKDDTGTETDLTATGGGGGGGGGAGGGSTLRWNSVADAPVPADENGLRVHVFAAGAGQKLYAALRVAQGYVAGSPITLRKFFYSDGTSGNVHVQAVATLIRPGTDAITSTTNQRTTTNAAVTLSAGTVNEPQALALDLTSATGQINGEAVSPGDLILIQLTRAAGDTATAEAKVLEDAEEVTYS